jgi:hypothetical protein
LFIGLGGLVAIIATVLAISSRTHPREQDNLSAVVSNPAAASVAATIVHPDTTLVTGTQQTTAQQNDISTAHVNHPGINEPKPGRNGQSHGLNVGSGAISRETPARRPDDRRASAPSAQMKPTASEEKDDEGEPEENMSTEVAQAVATYKIRRTGHKSRIREINNDATLSRAEKKKLIEEENENFQKAKDAVDAVKKKAKAERRAKKGKR